MLSEQLCSECLPVSRQADVWTLRADLDQAVEQAQTVVFAESEEALDSLEVDEVFDSPEGTQEGESEAAEELVVVLDGLHDAGVSAFLLEDAVDGLLEQEVEQVGERQDAGAGGDQDYLSGEAWRYL